MTHKIYTLDVLPPGLRHLPINDVIAGAIEMATRDIGSANRLMLKDLPTWDVYIPRYLVASATVKAHENFAYFSHGMLPFTRTEAMATVTTIERYRGETIGFELIPEDQTVTAITTRAFTEATGLMPHLLAVKIAG